MTSSFDIIPVPMLFIVSAFSSRHLQRKMPGASYSNIWETIMLLTCPEMAFLDVVGCS